MNISAKQKRKKILSIIFLLSILAFTPEKVAKYEFPVYRVVIDPGHGGVFLKNKDSHGDRYDPVSGKYLDYFAEGANFNNLYERDIVFNIATLVLKYLKLCSSDGDFEKFRLIAKEFTEKPIKKIYIETMLTREEAIPFDEALKVPDPNGPFRLYDYPREGEIQKGRISRINEFKPHLVVSLHLADTAPSDYIGMNGIIVPPYNVLKKGFEILKNKGRGYIPSKKILKSWFRESNRQSYKFFYLKDCSQYFTGYGIKKNYSIDLSDFKGYKHNMISWIYQDPPNWYIIAREHRDESQYSNNYLKFKEEGKFWEREKGIYEEFRRGNSFHNFGGDNYFATYEIIKYIIASLNNSSIDHKNLVPGKPFISIWSVPLLINAISAYIELGYLDRKFDRTILTQKQEEIAKGIAVGIYSLLTGFEEISIKSKFRPSGKAIDFEKYRVSDEKTYFDIVTE